ncbi:MAG: hypothetical protein JXR91_04050 [Deltaproteobacteria bacterium]|nr:hypothetical protein [Deltaproteobacteria bacterium]
MKNLNFNKLQTDNNLQSIHGEFFVTKLKLWLFLLFIIFFVLQFFIFKTDNFSYNYPVLVVGFGWFVINLSIFLIIKKNRFNIYVTYIAITTDIATIGLFSILSSNHYIVNYSSNIFTLMFFVIIAFGALRKGSIPVLVSSLFASITYLTISIYYYLGSCNSNIELLLNNNQIVATVNIIDQISKAVSMILTGWIISHITNKITEAEKQYQILFEHVPDGIILQNADGTIATSNSTFAYMSAKDTKDIGNRPIKDFFQSPVRDGENNVLKTSSQRPIHVNIAASKFYDKDDTSTKQIIAIRDITSQKDIKDKLLQVQKMDFLGQLAHGLAHDMNNLLGAISGSVSLVKRSLKRNSTSPISQKIENYTLMIADSTANASNILKKLMSMSVNSNRISEAVDLNDIIADIIDISDKIFGAGYTIVVKEHPQGPALIDAEKNTIFQAVLNICINAKEAMQDGGFIEISLTYAATPKELKSRIVSENLSKRWLKLSIADSGTGMDLNTLKSCYEPFFSTKKSELRGTGLGVPVAFSTIRKHGGILKIDSIPGKGTVVDIYLPEYGSLAPDALEKYLHV